jgi:hypothetical protein
MSTATLSEETAQELERFFLNPESNLESEPPKLSEIKKLNEEEVNQLDEAFFQQGVDPEFLDVRTYAETAIKDDIPTYADYFPSAFELTAGIGGPIVAEKLIRQNVDKLAKNPVTRLATQTPLGRFLTLGTVSAGSVFVGRFTGELTEDLIEGRKLDPNAALELAVESATQDAIVTALFGVAGQAGRRVFEAGKAAKDAKFVEKFKLTAQQAKDVVDLQKLLKNFDSTLLPSVLKDESVKGRLRVFLQNLSRVSSLTKDTINGYIENYPVAMSNQISNLIDAYRTGTFEQQGQLLTNLINQTDSALSAIVKPIYARIDAEGGKLLLPNIRENGRALQKQLRQPYAGSNAKGRTIYNVPNSINRLLDELSIPVNFTFQDAHERLSRLKGARHNVINSQSTDKNQRLTVLNSMIDFIQNSMDESAAILNPALKKEYDDVKKLYSEGKDVVTATYITKALEKDDPALIGRLIANTAQTGEVVGIRQVNQLKLLAKQYYERLKKENAQIPAEMQEALLSDPLVGIKEGFLRDLLSGSEAGMMSNLGRLEESLAEGTRLRDTFNALFKDDETMFATDLGGVSKIDQLIRYLKLLDSSAQGRGGALTLSQASKEIGAVTTDGPLPTPTKIQKILAAFLPPFLASKTLTPAAMDKVINLVDVAVKKQAANEPVPAVIERELLSALKFQRKATITASVLYPDDNRPKESVNTEEPPSEGLLTPAD